MWRRKTLLEQGDQELEVRKMQSWDDTDLRDGHARQQAAADVLVHGDSSDDSNEEDDIGRWDVASAWT